MINILEVDFEEFAQGYYYLIYIILFNINYIFFKNLNNYNNFIEIIHILYYYGIVWLNLTFKGGKQ